MCSSDREPQYNKLVNTFMRILLRVPTDNNYIFFKDQKKCMLCSRDFTMDSTVTPMPCPGRHYFHTECIEEWMQETPNPACPVCQVEITPDEIDDKAKEYRKTLLAHMDCCYNSSTSAEKVAEVDQNEQPHSYNEQERIELDFCHQGRPIMTERSQNPSPVTASPDLIDNQL